MPIINNDWKKDNVRFVGKAFDYSYANRMNKLAPIIGSVNVKSETYELTGSGGFGELTEYDGSNLNEGKMKRGFNTVITPGEYTRSVPIGYKQAKVDKSGICARTGALLGDGASMTVYMHVLRMFARAFDSSYLGGDDKAWAATDHPVASKGSTGRKYIPDPESGTYSNLITTALSVSAITGAQAKANRFLTPDGLPFLCDMDTLLVSPELEETAAKICGIDGKLIPEKDPSGDTNAANPVYGMKYIVLGGGKDGFSAKQWALCDRRLMQLMVALAYNTRPTVFDTEQDNPLRQLFTGYVDFGTGWGDARQIIFANPA